MSGSHQHIGKQKVMDIGVDRPSVCWVYSQHYHSSPQTAGRNCKHIKAGMKLWVPAQVCRTHIIRELCMQKTLHEPQDTGMYLNSNYSTLRWVMIVTAECLVLSAAPSCTLSREMVLWKQSFAKPQRIILTHTNQDNLIDTENIPLGWSSIPRPEEMKAWTRPSLPPKHSWSWKPVGGDEGNMNSLCPCPCKLQGSNREH